MKLLYKFLFLFLFWTNLSAVQVVRIQVDYSGDTHLVDLELFDDTASQSVANFLTYANDGRYNRTFITRNIPNFIIQTGSYTFRPIDPLTELLGAITATSGLQPVPTDGSLLNDFNLSNTRGTIAFAKLSNDPDSATSGWFINLEDNSENLDNQNGGFTVFGSVIDDGMTIADEISSFPSQPFIAGVIGPDFSDLPVVDYDFLTFPGVYLSNLVMLTSFTVIDRPIIRFTPSSVDFNLDIAGDGASQLVTITIKNTGNEIANIGTINNLNAPYSIKNDNCSNTSLDPLFLTPTSTCSLEIEFDPTTNGVFETGLIFPYSSAFDMATYSLTLPITGEGIPTNAVSTVSVENIDYDDTAVNSVTDEIITVRNKGGNALNITAINLIGTDNAHYSIDIAGCIVGSILITDETCDLTISFTPSSSGSKVASLEIISNANTTTVTLNGTATEPELTVQTTLDFIANVSQTVSELFLAQNTGTGNLLFTDITLSGDDAIFFTEQNNCPDTNNSGTPTQTLGNGGSCGIFIEFTPTDEVFRTATLTITSNDPIKPIFEINLTGRTGATAISVDNTFDVGTSQINGTSSSKQLTITNSGSAPLEISTISGLSTSSFSQINDCIGADVQILQDESCNVIITLITSTLGPHTATLVIESIDPSQPVTEVTITGYADLDSDGVTSSVELAAPNSGDGNNDGVTDNEQNNVASLVADNSDYITFISDNSILLDAKTAIKDITLINYIPDEKPVSASFIYGLYSYSVSLPLGDGANIAILLPPDEEPTTFYKYGPTTDNTLDHWYDFSYDTATATGAKFLGQVSIQSGTGKSIQKNLVIVSYIDGRRGDDDLEANSVIRNYVSGLSTPTTSPSSSSGTLSYHFIAFFLLLKLLFHSVLRYKQFCKSGSG